MKTTPEPLKIERLHWQKAAIAIVTLAVLAAALAAGLNFTGRSSFCGQCHAMKPYAASWEKSSHKKAGCADCHADPGFIGALVQRAEVLKHYSGTSVFFKLGRPTLASGVSSAGCLKCHQSIAERTVTGRAGIRVSHKEMIAAGLDCGRCHTDTGHASKATKTEQPAHTYCFACHQRLTGAAECSFCHTRDVGVEGPNQLDDYRKVEFDLSKCDGCHPTDTCGNCHETLPLVQEAF